MGIKEVLAGNLKALMSAKPGLSTLPKITAATDRRLSNGKLDRVRRAVSATDIETVEELAAVFGLEPWHLLSPSLKVTYTKGGKAQVEGAPAWPFAQLSPEAWQSISEEVRTAAEKMLLSSVPPAPSQGVGVAIDPKFSEELEELSRTAEEIHGKPSRKRNTSSKG